MIRDKQELFDAILEAKLPENLLQIWEGNVPDRLQFTLQEPSSLFNAFLSYPEGFPSSNELLILWQTNGESIVGYLPSSGEFIRNYLEDGPNEVEIIGRSYQQMLSELFAKLIMREVADEELVLCAKFLEFQYLTELKEFVGINPNWEDNTAIFIANIEAN